MASFQRRLISADLTLTRSFLKRRLTVGFLVALMSSTALVSAVSPVMADDTQQTKWSIAGAFLAGMNAKARGDMKTAAELLPLALASSPGNPGLIQATLYSQISNGDVVDAIKLAKTLTTSQPAAVAVAPLVTVLLTQDAIKSGQYDKALELARKLPDEQIGKYAGPMMRAWLVAGSKKDMTLALNELKPLEAEPGFAPFALMERAAIEDYLGRTDDALNSYKAAADASKTMPTLLLQMYGNLLKRQGKKDELNKLLDRFEMENAGNNDAISGPLVQSLRGDDKPKPLASTPAEGIAGVMSGMSVLLLQENIYTEALLFTRLSLDLKPDLDMSRILAGDIYRRTNRYDEAAAIYHSIDPKSVYFWSSELSLADTLRHQEKNDDAEKLLRQMSDSNQKNVEAPVLLGDLLRGQNKFDGAAAAYSTAIGRIGNPLPNDWSIFYFRGTAYERAKQWPKAEADFKKALELSPDQPYVLNYLAYTWVERREHLDQALKMLQTAVDARPEEGFIVDSLGWAHYQLGHYDDAVKYLERAVALSPQDPTLNDHLGDAYWRAGRHVEARFQWSRALNFKPEDDQVKVIETKVRDGLGPVGQTPSDTNKGAGGQSGSGSGDGGQNNPSTIKQNAG